MRLTVLGSSGTFAGPDDACSGYLVEHDGFRLVMDVGPGTLANLQRHLPLDRIDAVLLSHAHPDHWGELPTLCNAYRYVLGRDDLPVLGPADALACVEAALGGSTSPTFALEEAGDGDEFELGPIELRCSATDHPGVTLGFHLSAGDVAIGYSADTGPGWSLKEFNAPVTLGLCETSYVEAGDTGGMHLSAAEAGAMCRDAGVSFLAATHIVPGQDRDAILGAATSAFGGQVHLATPHLRFEL
jgi:ribonuclease BN (tRNA processing enzyme)